MEKDQTRKLVQYSELKPNECIDWLVKSYEDGVSCEEEDGPKEPVAKWIIGKKSKHPPQDHVDQQMVKNFIINIKQEEPAQPPAEQRHSMKTIIDEAFKNILIPIISGLNNCSGIFDPSIS